VGPRHRCHESRSGRAGQARDVLNCSRGPDALPDCTQVKQVTIAASPERPPECGLHAPSTARASLLADPRLHPLAGRVELQPQLGLSGSTRGGRGRGGRRSRLVLRRFGWLQWRQLGQQLFGRIERIQQLGQLQRIERIERIERFERELLG
jgi:hypothetical protein